METVVPRSRDLFNRSPAEAKRLLMLAGFRPVQKGEIPEHGDRVINCNRLYSRRYNSASTFESGTIDKPHKNSSPYAVTYDRITYYHAYSKSWFERVMWIRKAKQENTMADTSQKEQTFVVNTKTLDHWSHQYGAVLFVQNDPVTCTEEYALHALRRIAKTFPGHDFTLTRLVARSYTPVQQEFELL